MNREGKKYVSYVRVSTEMQVDGFSLDGQHNRIARFGEREEMVCVGKYEDAGKSGKSIEGRPDFKRMIADIENGLRVDYILVYKLSRFGRNAADILNSLERVQEYGVELICVEEGIDSSQTSGKLLISVLSAVAEIERENILEQTMNGRKEKARQGGWNGGPAPYGYILKDNQLFVKEEEAEIVRQIFEQFVDTNKGCGGIAKSLNLQGVPKTKTTKKALTVWSAHCIKALLDNPVYVGKIAYGRRVREKVKGKKDEYRVIRSDDYILRDGKHEAIIDEDTWERATKKRKQTGVAQKPKAGAPKVHLLSGILRCPKCGGLMYCNRHTWTKKDGTKKDVYYYYCGNSHYQRGSRCGYQAKLKTTDIEPVVVELIKSLVNNKHFSEAVNLRIDDRTDDSKVEMEIQNYRAKLKEIELNKVRLELEIDNMPADAKFRERKIQDMTMRLNALYESIYEIEEAIEDALLRKKAFEEEKMTLEKIRQILVTFDEVYDIMDESEKKDILSLLVKEVHINANDVGAKTLLRKIIFNFPVYYNNDNEADQILWECEGSVETLVCLSHKKPDGHISVNVEFGEEEGQVSLKDIEKRALECAPKKKTTYKDIQA